MDDGEGDEGGWRRELRKAERAAMEGGEGDDERWEAQ